ncbi:lycopene cyclase family protein [Actinomadura viridis]|uniref:Lycopene beta-cyclase n=1 Tax=Actinomadura viridis TaxID=58110 RepID=A0A931GGT3_9ACTN|nr:lycopene cyclase family protein [Actinomadura viridis]MBG6086117.1 lycopene beta-cyclase [Actinomadura viridis]
MVESHRVESHGDESQGFDSDVVIIGAGAAGLSLAHHLARTGPPGRRGEAPTVTLVEALDESLRPPERTWCFWEKGESEYEEAVVASWDRLRVVGRDGDAVVKGISPFRYKMLRSSAFEELVERGLSGLPGVRTVRADVHAVRDLPGGAEVDGTAAGGRRLRLRARWVYDSRPPRELPRARSTLLQHFRGWFVRTAFPAFDPEVVSLMDFRTPQPPRGLSFGYVLPFGPRDALIEYTEFSPKPLSQGAYEEALLHYTRKVLGIGPLEVRGHEQGVIPMTDAVFPRRAGRSVFRIGTAGGATRPSTGYTFAAVQRQSRAIAAAYERGDVPAPPPPYSPRARAMDAVMLRLLDRGRADGTEFFTGLFRTTPAERLLRFLDGDTRLGEDIAIGLRTPIVPMLRTVAELPLLPRRNVPAAPGRPAASESTSPSEERP